MRIFPALTLGIVLICTCAGSGVAQQTRVKRAPSTRNVSRAALMEAAQRGDVRAVRVMLRKGVDVDAKDTALMVAARNAHPELVKILLAAGANPNALLATAHSLSTPLGSAIRGKSMEVIDILIRAGAELNPKKNIFPLFFAVERNDGEMVRALIARGADVNLKNFRGMTALMLASLGCSPDMVKVLIDVGADVSLKDDDGNTAFALVEKLYEEMCDDKAEIVGLLKQAGARSH